VENSGKIALKSVHSEDMGSVELPDGPGIRRSLEGGFKRRVKTFFERRGGALQK